MPGIEEEVLAQLNKEQVKPSKEVTPPGVAAEEITPAGTTTAGQIGEDGKKRIHIFSPQFQAEFGMRKKKD